jgi:hypothetical protein
LTSDVCKCDQSSFKSSPVIFLSVVLYPTDSCALKRDQRDDSGTGGLPGMPRVSLVEIHSYRKSEVFGPLCSPSSRSGAGGWNRGPHLLRLYMSISRSPPIPRRILHMLVPQSHALRAGRQTRNFLAPLLLKMRELQLKNESACARPPTMPFYRRPFVDRLLRSFPIIATVLNLSLSVN